MNYIQERIEHRAYNLYLKRGKIPGFHEEDWKQAEKEVLAEIEAGKKTESERQSLVKTSPAPAVRVNKRVFAPVKAAVPEHPALSEKAADGSRPKAKATSSVTSAAKVIRKKK